MPLVKTAEPSLYRPKAHPVDILGITPGMPPDAVRAILGKQFGDAQPVLESMGLEYRGVMVSTQPFVTRMTARRENDEIGVWFATPTTGNGVVQVTRQSSYFDAATAPTLAQARTELIEKYGPPGFDGPAVGNGEVRLLAWSYKGDTPAACPRSSCREDLSDGVSVGDLARYQRAIRTGHELTIVATLLSSTADAAKAVSVIVVVSDAATKLRTLDAAEVQMKAPARPGGSKKVR